MRTFPLTRAVVHEKGMDVSVLRVIEHWGLAWAKVGWLCLGCLSGVVT